MQVEAYDVTIQCMELNATKQRIGVSISAEISANNKVVKQLIHIECTSAHTFKNGDVFRCCYFPKQHLQQLNYLESLIIKCFIEETMDLSEENTYFEWKITNYWLKKWKKANGKFFESPRFNAIGHKWWLQMHPDGCGKETAYLWIMCEIQEELNVCHYIGIDALNHCQITFDGNTVNKDRCHIACISPFQFHDIQNESEITICVKIWGKGAIHRNEHHFVLKDKMMKLQHQSAAIIRNLENEHLEEMQRVVKEKDKKIRSLQHEKQKAVKSLDAVIESLQTEHKRLQTENTKLNRKCQGNEILKRKDHLQALKSLDSFTQSLQSQIRRLQTENGELNEECKETKLELIHVKKELLQRERMDNYLEWNPSQVVDWIISIGDYAQYEQNLRLFFAKETVNGAVLSQISKQDLKDWGIHNFSHRSNLYQQIRELINQQYEGMQNIEGQCDTAEL